MDQAVDALISWGAEIDRPDESLGMTPLHLAVLSGSRKTVRVLVQSGCDISIKNNNSKTALDLAE